MISSKADMKRTLTEGTDVYVANMVSGKVVDKEHRTVVISQTNAVAFETPDKDQPVWLYYNNDFEFAEDYFSMETLMGNTYRYYLDESKWRAL